MIAAIKELNAKVIALETQLGKNNYDNFNTKI
jgi:hypothetical protein